MGIDQDFEVRVHSLIVVFELYTVDFPMKVHIGRCGKFFCEKKITSGVSL